MTAKELRELTDSELQTKLKDLKQARWVTVSVRAAICIRTYPVIMT